MLTQIYGITCVEDATAVDLLGPDHVGVVVDEGIDTWDSVDDDTAMAIAGALHHARIVALSLSTEPDRIAATADLLHPAFVHLARAHLMDDVVLEIVREHVAPAALMLTVPVTGAGSVEVAQRLERIADVLLLDSRDPGSGVVGATGLTHDWTISRRVVEAVGVPVILAGGLGPDNVVDAIRRVDPAGVDSETHTSHVHDRRRKDLRKVEAFIAAARAAIREQR